MNSALQVVGEEACGWPVVRVQDGVSVGVVGVTSDVGAPCRRDRGYKPLLQVVSSPGAYAGRINSALQVVGEEECGRPVVGVQDGVSVGAVGVTSDVGAPCRRDRGYKPLLQVVSSPGSFAGRMNSALQVVGEKRCGRPVVGFQDGVPVEAVGVTSCVGGPCSRDRGYKPLLQVVSSPGACAGRMNSALPAASQRG